MNKVKNIFFKILNFFVKTYLEIFIFDKRIRRILKGKFCKWYIKKYINDVEFNFNTQLSKKGTYRIWQYWDSGFENAPEIIKTCINSVDKYRGNIERILLNDNNIQEYVHIPKFYYELKDKGIIKAAHFADILRTYLLYEHGGCWIDASVLLTDKLPEYIYFSNLFVFKSIEEDDPDELSMTNYFMASDGTSILIAKMKDFLDKYWQDNDFAINYFFYMYAFTLFTKSSQENKKEFDKIFYFPYSTIQQMEKELSDIFSFQRFEQLKSMSSIHKLSYKQCVFNKHKKTLSNSLYNYLLLHK